MEAGYYAITGVGPSLGSGVSGAFEVQLLGVGKVDTHEPYTLANEFICAQLASALGLPVPPATIAETNTGEKVFVSLKYTVGPTSLPAVDPAELVADRPDVAAGIVVFDCWVGNWDRHAGNVAYVRGASGVSIFDHGRSLLRTPTGQGAAAVQAGQDDPHLHVPQNVLCDHVADARLLARWAERVAAVPEELVRDAGRAASRLGVCTDEEASAVAGFLLHRKERIMSYLSGNQSLLPKVTNWETL